ncbi:MAG: F0F1 ATP synthase subunit delta [Deltaproteobacteria bacterium]|nr:F0F1 ATP synthase subunit delta [Deltaproteobacteria bacterium]MCX7953152.1 F0F1 ATP synthase subunit delta [Deltaproteobacteria bacterium]
MAIRLLSLKLVASSSASRLKAVGLSFEECQSILRILHLLFKRKNDLLTHSNNQNEIIKLLQTKYGEEAIKLVLWFIELLKKTKSAQKVKSFLASFEKELFRAFEKKKVVVVSASELTQSEREKLISLLIPYGVKNDDSIRFLVDPSLIGSFRVFINGTILDASFETLINQFYNF